MMGKEHFTSLVRFLPFTWVVGRSVHYPPHGESPPPVLVPGPDDDTLVGVSSPPRTTKVDVCASPCVGVSDDSRVTRRGIDRGCAFEVSTVVTGATTTDEVWYMGGFSHPFLSSIIP